jgi:Zn-dependent M28 family amino/carboxypeptidase
MTPPERARCLAFAAASLLLALCVSSRPAAGQAAAPAVPAPSAASVDGAALLASITALTAPGMDGRATGTDGARKAQAWIEARLGAIGVRPAWPAGYAVPFTFTNKAGVSVTGTNLVARCEGRRADAPYLVVSAHYDHLGIRSGQTYHGADDNASGVAMLLHVAARCRTTPFEHPLLLAFFDAEEAGLQGAQAFVTAPPVPVARLALNVNFDMVSRSATREIFVAGPGRWPALRPMLDPAVAKAPVTVRFGHDTGGGQNDWTTQSDHGAFHAAGIPFIYFGVEDHPDYHKPTDTPEKIAPDFLGGVATVVLRVLDALDRASAYK